MVFNPGIDIGAELSNNELCALFKCGNMGGMRRSKKTGTLVIVSDHTKELYDDVWKNGVLYYTGMGKTGDQGLTGNQNVTLYNANTNGVEVHLFEVFEEAVYTYRGVVKLVDQPYQTTQRDGNGEMRSVWIFPVKPIVDIGDDISNDLEKVAVKLSNAELTKRYRMNRSIREPKVVEATVYYRDPYLKVLVKRIAGGICQYCGAEAPFLDRNNEPYLEEHHVKWLSRGGSDTIENVVAVCPNCHSKAHELDSEEIEMTLNDVAQQNANRLKRILAYEQGIKSLKKEQK